MIYQYLVTSDKPIKTNLKKFTVLNSEAEVVLLRPHGNLIEQEAAINELEYSLMNDSYDYKVAEEAINDTHVFIKATT